MATCWCLAFIFFLVLPLSQERRRGGVRLEECGGTVRPVCCTVCLCDQGEWQCAYKTCHNCPSNIKYMLPTRPMTPRNGKCEVGSSWSTGRCGHTCFCEENNVVHCVLHPCVVVDHYSKGRVAVKEVSTLGLSPAGHEDPKWHRIIRDEKL